MRSDIGTLSYKDRILIRRRIRHKITRKRNRVRQWADKFTDVPCFILGNAPSLDDHPIHRVNGYFSIGINRIYKRISPTILIWQDIELYYDARKELLGLDSILFSKDTADPRNIAYHFKLLNGGYRLTQNPTVLAGRGSTAPLAFQLAHCLGCNPIILVGCDCKYRGAKTDFYGTNKDHNQNTLSNCSRGLNWIKSFKGNREIISCSESDIFHDTMSLDQVLNRPDIEKHQREKTFYRDLLLQ